MRKNKDKTKSIFLNIVACLALTTLITSGIHIPKASAAESYFTAEGGTLELDKVEPDQRTIWVKLKAAREMTIHYLEGYFTPVENDEDLEYGFGDISAVYPGMGGNSCSLEDGWFYWNAEEYMDPSVSSEGIHVQAGDAVFEVAYDVKPGVEVMKRNMPVTLELAIIDEGSETGKEIRNITMDAYVRAGHDLSVYKYITGNGDLDVPSIVVGGTDVEVRIVPEPGNELVYLELNGQEVTDQIQDNIFRVTPGTESLTFYATFRRVYEVLEGDGAEHVIGSDEPLAFKIDNDVTTFCGTGNLIIDGEYQDMRTYCTVDPDNQTIILPASFLNTLTLGEHSFEAYFTEPDSGSAKASFKIVEAKPDDDEDEEDIPVPNTGAFTSEGGSAKIAGGIISSVVIISIVIAKWFLIRKARQE
ncbi:hypothetical protein IKG60_00385 [Candidatus Saccharibacteria bacterium]|nr:hypothetical protein [Candidatus Saccharibacteria bacterium]